MTSLFSFVFVIPWIEMIDHYIHPIIAILKVAQICVPLLIFP